MHVVRENNVLSKVFFSPLPFVMNSGGFLKLKKHPMKGAYNVLILSVRRPDFVWLLDIVAN